MLEKLDFRYCGRAHHKNPSELVCFTIMVVEGVWRKRKSLVTRSSILVQCFSLVNSFRTYIPHIYIYVYFIPFSRVPSTIFVIFSFFSSYFFLIRKLCLFVITTSQIQNCKKNMATQENFRFSRFFFYIFFTSPSNCPED